MLTKNNNREQRICILQQPLHQQYILHYSNTNGGVVLIHKLVDTSDSDYELLVAIGIVLANDGQKTELLPRLHERDVDFRNKVLPGVRMNKNPAGTGRCLNHLLFKRSQHQIGRSKYSSTI